MIDVAVEQFLNQPYLAHLATINPDGSPQLTPLWFAWHDGEILMTVVATRLKVRNIRRDGRVALSISSPPPTHRRVLIRGTATVSDQDIEAITRRIASRYVEPERLPERMRYLLSEPRVIIRIRPERISANV